MRRFFERIVGRVYTEEKCLRHYQVSQPSDVDLSLRTQSNIHLCLLLQVIPQPTEKKNIKIFGELN